MGQRGGQRQRGLSRAQPGRGNAGYVAGHHIPDLCPCSA